MRTLLGKLILAPALMAAAALAASSAMAEANIKVPFNFSAGGKSWPAGDYSVLRGSTLDTVTLRSNSTMKSVTWQIGPGEPGTTDTKVSLKFDQLGGQRVLRTIQYGAQITPVLDRQSKGAKEIVGNGR
jgi:hypothetical protein